MSIIVDNIHEADIAAVLNDGGTWDLVKNRFGSLKVGLDDWRLDDLITEAEIEHKDSIKVWGGKR